MFTKCVFISGETPTNDFTSNLRALLEGYSYSFIEVNGCYEGSTEKSFKVEIEHDWQVRQLLTFGKVFNQDSILDVVNGQAKLVFCQTNEVIELGTLEVNNEIVDNYSIINNVKYAIAA